MKLYKNLIASHVYKYTQWYCLKTKKYRNLDNGSEIEKGLHYSWTHYLVHICVYLMKMNTVDITGTEGKSAIILILFPPYNYILYHCIAIFIRRTAAIYIFFSKNPLEWNS